jgi:hypothetical protein
MPIDWIFPSKSDRFANKQTTAVVMGMASNNRTGITR